MTERTICQMEYEDWREKPIDQDAVNAKMMWDAYPQGAGMALWGESYDWLNGLIGGKRP